MVRAYSGRWKASNWPVPGFKLRHRSVFEVEANHRPAGVGSFSLKLASRRRGSGPEPMRRNRQLLEPRVMADDHDVAHFIGADPRAAL